MKFKVGDRVGVISRKIYDGDLYGLEGVVTGILDTVYEWPYEVLIEDKEYLLREDEIDLVPAVTKSSGERDEFSGGGVRDKEGGRPRFDLLCPERVPYEHQYLTRVARLMARGAEHYEARNWEQFADESALNRARSSAFRHFMQWFNGEADEDHAAAIYFNVMAAEYIQGRLDGKW